MSSSSSSSSQSSSSSSTSSGTVDLDIDGVDDQFEEILGAVVVRRADGNDAPRKKIRLECTISGGNVTLTRNNSKVKVFTAAEGGTEITFNGTDNKFAVGSLPMDLFVQRHEASASQSDVLLTLTHDGGANDKVRFTVLWATVAAKHSGQMTNDNSARDVYQAFAHPFSYNLGYQLFQTGVLHTFFSFSPQYAADGIGSEFVGTIQPSNFGPSDFGSSLRLYREILNGKRWVGMNGNGSDSSSDVTPGSDLSNALYVDFDPQSGGSNGKIYDFDGPGPHRDLGIPQPEGTKHRTRINFRFRCDFFESALSDPVRCSENADWYTRQSYVRGPAATWAFAGATSGGNNTVTVNNAGWANNQWQGGIIRVVSGTGMGQIRGIASNTADTITVSSAWLTGIPGNGSSIRLEKKAGWVQLNDINGDNRNGDGSTNTSWNLQ